MLPLGPLNKRPPHSEEPQLIQNFQGSLDKFYLKHKDSTIGAQET